MGRVIIRLRLKGGSGGGERGGGKPNETKQRGLLGMSPSERGSQPQQQEALLKERRFIFKKRNALLWFNLSSHCLKKEKALRPSVRPGYTLAGRNPLRVKLLTLRAA